MISALTGLFSDVTCQTLHFIWQDRDALLFLNYISSWKMKLLFDKKMILLKIILPHQLVAGLVVS